MSMWLNYAKLTPSSFEKVRTTPSLVEALFFESEIAAPPDFDSDKDVFGEDYRTISEVKDAMEAEGIEVETLARAMGEGAGAAIDYDFCYGPGFVLTPDEVRDLAAQLTADPDGFGISEFFAEAAREGKGIVGGIS